MTAYVDTSALLRLVLREPGAIEELRTADALVSSELIAVESARTIDDSALGLAARTFGFESSGWVISECRGACSSFTNAT